MRISVKAEDIESGYRNNCKLCPVALAILRHFPDGCTARVDLGGSVCVWDIGTGKRTDYWVPTRVVRAIYAYDAGEDMKPFAFDMRKEVP